MARDRLAKVLRENDVSQNKKTVHILHILRHINRNKIELSITMTS